MRTSFPDHKYLPATGYLQYVVEGLPLRLIALDTLVDGHGHGEMGAEQLDWLEARLGESKKPTVLFMHHPPFDTGVSFFDGHKLNVGAERLAEIVARHPQVERVMCGHVHRSIQVRFAGTLGSTAPSTAHQATLNLLPGAPLTMMMEPPGLALHYWHPSAGLVTHTSVIGDFEGPKPFRSM
jgi:3',5'-cyclic AMP phosphodiesterase CpdA